MSRSSCITGLLFWMSVVTASAVELPDQPVQRLMEQWRVSQQVMPSVSSYVRADFDNGAEPAGSGRKSVSRALLYSAILPGWGEHYLGHKTRAKFFFAAEAIGWVGLASFGTYANWREDDFMRFAADKANADLNGKDEFFFDMVGFYQDTDDYNARGRVSDPDRPYFANNAANHWRWQNSQDQAAYRHLKDRAREADRRTDFMIGALLLNRVVSMIDAVYHARRQDRGEAFGRKKSPSYHLAVEPDIRRGEVRLSLSARF